MRIRVLDRARKDLFDGYDFYERNQPGIGELFFETLTREIDALADNAGIHSKHLGAYHRLLTQRFPFAIYYRVVDGEARIYAVVDCRRDPAWIQDHLGKL